MDKKEALKRIDLGFKKLDKIHSNYSSKEIKNEFDKVYHYIIFTNIIKNLWSLNNSWKINSFIEFYWLKFNKKDKLNFFYHNYMYYFDYFDLSWNDEIIAKYSIKDFFEKEIYLDLDERDLKDLYITSTKDLNAQEFWEYFYKWYTEDFFASVYYTYYDNHLMDCKYKYDKKIIINTLSYLYNVLWKEFEINQEMFNKKQEISFMEFIIAYYHIWFIDITEVSMVNLGNITYGIRILPKLWQILDEIEEKRDIIMDKIFDEKYKQLTIKKKNWEVHLLEWDLEFLWDDTKFVDLKNKYPHCEIKADNYNWKINKYKVKEKIKFDNKKELL